MPLHILPYKLALRDHSCASRAGELERRMSEPAPKTPASQFGRNLGVNQDDLTGMQTVSQHGGLSLAARFEAMRFFVVDYLRIGHFFRITGVC